jgi:SSS family transporter
MMKTVETIVTLLYIIICIGIGIWASKKVSSSTDDYWVAGRKVGVFTNSWALMAALGSGGSILGVNGLGYTMGIPYVFAMFAGAAAGYPLAAVLVARQMRNMEVRTIPEFLTIRYKNKAIDTIVPIIIMICMEVYVVAQLKAAGITAQYLLGIPYNIAVIITALVFTLYVSIGGMWAITLTDFIQGMLMVFMVLLVAIMVFVSFGGVMPLLVQATEASDVLGNVAALPVSGYIGAFLAWFIAGCTVPHLVMRIFTTTDVRSARLSLNYAVIIYAFLIVFGVLAISSVGHVMFPDLPDADMLFLKVIERYLPSSIIGGVAVAAVMAAVMSTTDALLLAVSSAFVNDVYGKFINPNISEKGTVKLSIIVTWVAGLLAILFALNPPKLLTMLYTAAVGLLGSSLMPAIVLGIWWKKANAKGALWSIIIGGLTYCYLLWFTKMPALSHINVSLPVSFLVNIVVSNATYKADEEMISKVQSLHV